MKGLFETLTTAWVGVATDKLRSILTILGIVIGVAAVISLMSIGKGAQADILSRIQSLGSDHITIRPGSSTFGGVRSAAGSVQSLTQEDAGAILQQVSYIDSVAPTYSRSMQLIVGSKNTNSQVTGVPPEYQKIQNLEVASGTFISAYDYDSGARVAVVGSDTKTTLFGDDDPIGQEMRMGSNIVRVIGVLKAKGSVFGSPDSSILIPLTAMQKMVAQPRTSQGDRVVSSIEVKVSDEKQSAYIVGEMTAVLRTRHRLSTSTDNDFQIQSMEEISQTLTQATGTLTLLLGAIAAISLLVGGIGVMNIMLVSVLERTKEIGIRKAVGAQEHDIWIQFLIEAALLTLAGGLIGSAVGWLTSYFVNKFAQMTTIVSPDIVVLAVSVSVGIGLFFGFYPAWNASRLNPIEALRSE